MSKRIKGLIERELKSDFDGISEMVVVSLRGINGNDNNELRGELSTKNIKLKVVKNSLAIRAFKQVGVEGMESILDGPSAIVYGGDNIVDIAKLLADWDKKLDNLEIKGGYVEGEVLDAAAAKALSKMLTRSEQQGFVVQLAQSPGSKLAGAIGSAAGNIAGCIKTLIENLEEAA